MNNKILAFTFSLALSVSVMAQTASFKYFAYTGNDSRFNKQIDCSKQYFNPILAGFYPTRLFVAKTMSIIWSILLSLSIPECLFSQAKTLSTGNRWDMYSTVLLNCH